MESNQHCNKHLQRAWNKYGKSNFEFSILEECADGDSALEREKYWVNYYNSFNNGYNMNEGGTGNSGYVHSEESIQLMKKAQKERMSKPESRKVLSEAHNEYKKPIVQYNILTNEITYWDSCNNAGKTLNFHISSILECIKNRKISAMNSLWFYANEWEIIKKDFNPIQYMLNIGSTSVYDYMKYYQYDYLGNLLKIWTNTELFENKYRGQIVYKCCKGIQKSYKNTIWLFDFEKDKIYSILHLYEKEREIYSYSVNIYDNEDNYIETLPNIIECHKKYNIRIYDILQACKGIRKSLYNLIFKFQNYEYIYNEGRKIGEKKRENLMNKIKRKIGQYDLDMNLIKKWDSITEVHNTLGYDRGCLIRCCQGKTPSSHNYIWKYIE